MIKIDGLKENENNPRTIQSEAFQRLCDSITRDPEFMMLRPIVVDDSGVILGGNMRYRAIKKLGMSEIPDGWVAKASNLSEEQKKRFILVDNSPSGMVGDWDYEILANMWEKSELEALGFDIEEFSDSLKGVDLENPYTKKIETPVYEITGEKPDLETLQDKSKTEVLIEEIRAANIPEDVKAFLYSAAERHTVFNFRNIAEYYAHAEPEVQNLMERSALVIIDYDRAVEEGYVKLTNSLIEQMREECAGDDDDAQ